MYEHLRGRLISKDPARVVLEVGGVGYRALVPVSTYEQLPAEGTDLLLFTTLVVREDSQRLYGFGSRDERTFFETLQSVSGVGPAVALGIVSAMPFAGFRAAVLAGDAAALRRVKGVGKRLSERLVVELKDVLGGLAPTDTPDADDAAVLDALLALEALGFTRTAGEKALRKLRQGGGDAKDPGDLVREALKLL